jgi:hypothetical protein
LIFTLGFLAAERDHVRRDIAAVNVESGSKVRDEQTAGAAGNVERRLTSLDVLLKVRDLGAIFVELGPPPRNEAVVPGLWRVRHVSGPPLSYAVVNRRRSSSAACAGEALLLIEEPSPTCSVTGLGAPGSS